MATGGRWVGRRGRLGILLRKYLLDRERSERGDEGLGSCCKSTCWIERERERKRVKKAWDPVERSTCGRECGWVWAL